MKNVKKLLALLLAAVMVMSMAACGSESSSVAENASSTEAASTAENAEKC